MRQEDSDEVGQYHRDKRIWQTAFGFLVAISGLVAFFLLRPTSARVDIGIACAVLLGGMYIDPKTMTDTVKLFTPFLPWGKK